MEKGTRKTAERWGILGRESLGHCRQLPQKQNNKFPLKQSDRRFLVADDRMPIEGT